jgi:glutathione S-transferase
MVWHYAPPVEAASSDGATKGRTPMIQFYGSPMSSAGRTHWMLEEVSAPYEYHRTNPRDGSTRTPEFLAINPAGTVPAIVDDGFHLSESVAINFYLAEKYRPELLGGDAQERAIVHQWSLWAMTNLLPELLTIMRQSMLPEAARNFAAVDAAKSRVEPMLAYLEQSLRGREYLVGGRFTLADVNAGSVVNLGKATGLLESYPDTAAWLAGLAARPAWKRAVSAG